VHKHESICIQCSYATWKVSILRSLFGTTLYSTQTRICTCIQGSDVAWKSSDGDDPGDASLRNILWLYQPHTTNTARSLHTWSKEAPQQAETAQKDEEMSQGNKSDVAEMPQGDASEQLFSRAECWSNQHSACCMLALDGQNTHKKSHLVVLNTADGSALGNTLVFDGQNEFGTVWEGDFGTVVADILYMDNSRNFCVDGQIKDFHSFLYITPHVLML